MACGTASRTGSLPATPREPSRTSHRRSSRSSGKSSWPWDRACPPSRRASRACSWWSRWTTWPRRRSCVQALAEWQAEGGGGRANGPLMVRDTVSGSDGLISFDAWGPIEGPWTGLVIGSDPVVTLFKSGYKALILNNGYLPPGRERERVRRFVRKDSTHALEPFRGTPEEWLRELQRVYAGRAFSRSDDQSLKFRVPYSNRLKLISNERDKTPADEDRKSVV